MAPIRSKMKRTATKSGRGALPSSKPSLFEDEFRTSKKDKRLIKHASFVSKIEKSSQKKPKRRRASKKLIANLDSLADALSEAEVESNPTTDQVNVIKQKTLEHKPGAIKRKEKLEKLERDRFAKNMAQMTGMHVAAADNTGDATTEQNPTSNRWAALRNFISQTMEQQPVFKINT